MIHCPCPSCGFRLFQSRDDAYDHLLMKPFPTNYTFWLHHGERHVGESSSERHEREPCSVHRDPMRDMVHEAFNFQGFIADEEDSSNEYFGGLPKSCRICTTNLVTRPVILMSYLKMESRNCIRDAQNSRSWLSW
ncbi:hypothetical protein Ahy_B06g081755 [Arachis hypogaea]|uniref:Transposase-associated domain-containing protein n=1 Tax=Arachis hypogaea TaxID=3818 RepID=A0A444YLW0_ARAHY|nr:hypothetical protein Ahy_B06g081755 [Arachis hypogaea]